MSNAQSVYAGLTYGKTAGKTLRLKEMKATRGSWPDMWDKCNIRIEI